MKYLCQAEQRGQMMAVTIIQDLFYKNNEAGLLLSHQTKESSLSAWNRKMRKPIQYG